MKQIDPHARIHPSAEIGDGCVVEADCHIGPNVRIGPNCRLECGAVVRGEASGGAQLGEGCIVEALAYIGPRVKMGKRNRIHHHGAVEGATEMGDDNQVGPGAVLGGLPQDLGEPAENTRVVIGDGNVFREAATVNSGTRKEDGVTTIGSGNLLMAGSHVGHDCAVEDKCIIGNGSMLGGHVHIDRGAILGGDVVCSPFMTIGRYAFVGGACSGDRDLPPFMIAHGGYQARVCGVNIVGLRRNGFSNESVRALDAACKKLYLSRSTSMEKALEELERDGLFADEVKYLIAFTRASLSGRFMRAREAIRMNKAKG